METGRWDRSVYRGFGEAYDVRRSSWYKYDCLTTRHEISLQVIPDQLGAALTSMMIEEMERMTIMVGGVARR